MSATQTLPRSVFQPPFAALTWGIVLSVGLVAFESMGVATILPEVAGRLGGLGAYGWGLSALMLANVIGTIAAGSAADRHGPARPLGVGLAVFAIGCAVAGAAGNWPLFLAGRFIQGLGVGAVMALAYTVIGVHYPDRLKSRMYALVSGAWTVPSLAGPVLAGVIAEYAHWRGVFWLLLPLIALASAMTLPPLARRDRERATTASPRGTWWRGPVALSVLISAGTGLLLLSLELDRLILLVPLGIAGAVAAVIGLRAVLPAGTLRGERGVPTGIVIRFLLCGAYFGSEAFLPLGLIELRGISAAVAGLGLSAGAITWVAGAAWQGRADERWTGRSRAVPIRLGAALLAAGVVILGVAVLVEAVPPLVAILGWAVGGTGMGIAFNAATADALEQAPAARQGEASGSLQLAQTLSVAVVSGLGGAAIAFANQYGGTTSAALAGTFALTGAMAAAAALAARRIR